MPTYVRACVKCQHEFDVFRKMAHVRDPEACPKCGAETENVPRPGGSPKTAVFPYTHPHLTGSGPVVVESLHHLRQLERKYGVVATAFSNHTSNQIDPITNVPRHRPGGRDYEDR